MSARTEVRWFHDAPTGSLQYVAWDPATKKAAIIDAVWNYDPAHAATSTRSADEILDLVAREGLDVVWILDTHPHADHLIAAPYLQAKLGAPTGIGEKVTGVQELWKGYYHLPDDFPTDGRQWDHLFRDGETFRVGELEGRVIFSPGHTLASITYVIGDAAFVHDTLMMPDAGTSRADFPGGDARTLWTSIQKILSLPDETRLFVGHDYCPNGRAVAAEATVAEHKATNVHLAGTSEEEYVRLREERDATLPLPDRMLAALQVNIRGGRMPEPEADGRSYLRLPVDLFTPPRW